MCGTRRKQRKDWLFHLLEDAKSQSFASTLFQPYSAQGYKEKLV